MSGRELPRGFYNGPDHIASTVASHCTLKEPPSLDSDEPPDVEEFEADLRTRRCRVVREAAHDGVSCQEMIDVLPFVDDGADAAYHALGYCECPAGVPPVEKRFSRF